MEQAISQFSQIPVKHFIELGCGNSPHLEELSKRGYAYTGVDLSEEMLAFSRQKAEGLGIVALFIKADMADFEVDGLVDFAYVMLGSLFLKNTMDLVSHFDSISRAVRPGGLYLLDWCIRFDTNDSVESSWETRRGKTRVKATFSSTVLDKVEQIYKDYDALEVFENGEARKFESKSIRRVIFPQEFRSFISGRGDFKFLGWWNNWDLDVPLRGDQKINRPIVLLRRQ